MLSYFSLDKVVNQHSDENVLVLLHYSKEQKEKKNAFPQKQGVTLTLTEVLFT